MPRQQPMYWNNQSVGMCSGCRRGEHRLPLHQAQVCECECHDMIRMRSKKPKAATGPATKRMQIYQRDGFLCRYCGLRVYVGGTFPSHLSLTTAASRIAFLARRRSSLDHVIPLSRGGSKDASNLVTACRECNGHKADRTPEEAGMPLLPIGTARPELQTGT